MTPSSDTQRPTPPMQKERHFQDQVLRAARLLGWTLRYHTHDSRHSPSGFPDLVLVRERVVWAELKTDTGKLSAAQTEWINGLLEAGQEALVWRPRDWSQIVDTLTRRENSAVR